MNTIRHDLLCKAWRLCKVTDSIVKNSRLMLYNKTIVFCSENHMLQGKIEAILNIQELN
jgi:hypothetical protein